MVLKINIYYITNIHKVFLNAKSSINNLFNSTNFIKSSMFKVYLKCIGFKYITISPKFYLYQPRLLTYDVYNIPIDILFNVNENLIMPDNTQIF